MSSIFILKTFLSSHRNEEMFSKSNKNNIPLWSFLISIILYGCIGFYFAYFTLLPFHQDYIHDLYLGFDNTFINTSAVRHPLLKGISQILSSIITHQESFWIISICSMLLALHIFFLAKILTHIIKLDTFKTWAVLLFYMGFSTNFILCFTFESYVFSLFFITLFLWIFYTYQEKNKKLPNSLFYIFLFLVGGITITNGGKIFFINYANKPKTFFQHSLMILFLSSPILFFYDSIANSIQHSMQFIQSGTDYFSDIFYLFLGGAMVFPNLEIQNINYENQEMINIIIAQYPDLFSIKTLLISNVLFLIIFSVAKNMRNQNIYPLLIFFSFDIFIHAIMRFSLNEAQIFGGNFIFIYPILIGFLLKNTKYSNLITIHLVLISIGIYFVNFHDLFFISEFGKTFYPK